MDRADPVCMESAVCSLYPCFHSSEREVLFHFVEENVET